MKTLKRKNILLASMLLGTVALSTVGFAAWVISQGDEQSQAGTITVDTVTDESHFVTIVTEKIDETHQTETAISFGAAAPERGSGWLSFEDQEGDHPEDLTAVVYFQVSNADKEWLETSGNVTLALSATPEVEEGQKDAYTLAYEAGLVGELPSVTNGGIVFSTETINEVLYCKAAITFTWGSKFTIQVDNTSTNEEDDDFTATVVNPVDYYNSLPFTQDNVNAAKTMLQTTLPTALAGVGWKLTITTAA